MNDTDAVKLAALKLQYDSGDFSSSAYAQKASAPITDWLAG